MTTLHVREIPDSTISTLKVRAAKAGQSLQAYVRQLLEREAALLSTEEAAVKAREIAARSSVTSDDILAAIQDSRRELP